MRAYRFLTGDDTSEFCHKVTKALNEGWSLFGSPVYAPCPDTGKMRCGQAVIKDGEGTYFPEVNLGEF
ncbi:DUF1737 domain-containing protein [Aliiroseovarius sp. PTFE2010]|uniref:DUF1737 domain-containing protein n=1 Tax=Aliiroseovarius sp. PTFE2010 TaxID=3417190 RepID=UPI003CF090FC